MVAAHARGTGRGHNVAYVEINYSKKTRNDRSLPIYTHT